MSVPPAISENVRRGRRARRRHPKTCAWCGKNFMGMAKTTKYCSRSCQSRGIKQPVVILEHYDVEDRSYQTPCWMYRRSGTNRGYNQVKLPDGTQPLAHRYFYEQLVGPIPGDLTLDHLCRVRGCVNPAHMEPVTRGENVLRGEGLSAQNARKTHCKNGHPFDLFNTYIRSGGARLCRICMRRARSS